ncbi:MAG: trypsin-like peptidase domain-containing protein [Jatrophihabitans sp.]|uniref:S1C family serine protease n=1 Tax=Jatrophihabitans sp. TaxID=1932789 RepID=UPI003F809A4B
MTEHGGTPAPQAAQPPVDPDGAFGRPDGVAGGFAPRAEPPAYAPPPPTVSPAEQAVFGRPQGAGAFAPAPGERLAPTYQPPQPTPRIYSEAFGPTPGARDGFAPAPGTRLEPRAAGPGSPWWKPDAQRDPWRDPNSPFWLGRGAIFARGQFAQRAPELDEETAADDEVEDADEATPAAAAPVAATPRLRLLVLMTVVALLVGAVGGVVGWFIADTTGNALHRDDVSLAQVDKPANRPPGSVADLARRVGPAVVQIDVQTPQGAGVGSGVVIDKHGYVLTNNPVVAGATNILVVFSDEATSDAKIVGTDPVSDLAVIKVSADKLTVATLGNSDTLAVGDPVIAIGSPRGLTGTVTAGIVSAKNRPVPVANEDGSADAVLDAIQTDAPINPGNSGGALVDAAGAVVGINSAAALGSSNGVTFSGLGFAIPINYARDIAQQLIRTGKAVHGSLSARGHSVQSGIRFGAYLSQVQPGGAAAKAGLRNGDVIVVATGRVVQTFDALQVVVEEHKPGDKLDLTFYRGSAKHTVTVTLDKA